MPIQFVINHIKRMVFSVHSHFSCFFFHLLFTVIHIVSIDWCVDMWLYRPHCKQRKKSFLYRWLVWLYWFSIKIETNACDCASYNATIQYDLNKWKKYYVLSKLNQKFSELFKKMEFWSTKMVLEKSVWNKLPFRSSFYTRLNFPNGIITESRN